MNSEFFDIIRAEMQDDCAGMRRVRHGLPGLLVERYAGTLVFADNSADGSYRKTAEAAAEELPCAILYKWRKSRNFRERNGSVLQGEPDRSIVEHGVKYAVDLMLNQDNSFYGDTRELRRYLLENSAGREVLNTFAYTGSLGVAALAGGAEKVVQSDLSGKFLALAKESAALNDLDEKRMEIVEGNFFPVVSRLKKERRQFDIIILDPPFFSSSSKGSGDLLNFPVALVNKVRPLAADGGEIIMVNNALFLSGKDFLAAADALCDNEYLRRAGIINIPEEFCSDSTVADPAPFNHPTKILRFQVKRKKA